MTRRGLIVGKFYPPHRGHRFLIETSHRQVDHLVVMICQKPGENPPGELRTQWLRELCPEVEVLLIDDQLDSDDSQLWAQFTRQVLGYAPDVVFGSEDYLTRFAHFLGCEAICVDKSRRQVPISGTRVRENPLAAWDYLDPPLREFYAKRVCLVGAESTGKTTLAQALAEHFQTDWVSEYGREYSERKIETEGFAAPWSSAEFTLIAQRQCEWENAAARSANRVLICDTDAFATSIWHRRYMNERSPEVEAVVAAHRRPDLYLLTDVDIPFVQDGTRDGEHIRHAMYEMFLTELVAQSRPFELLSGSPEERLQKAVSLIEPLLK